MKRFGGSFEEDLVRTYKRELYVYNETLKNSIKFNKAELKHAKFIIDKAKRNLENVNIDINNINID